MHTRLFSRNYFLSLATVVVIAFSCFGVLGEYSDNYTDASIIEAGASCKSPNRTLAYIALTAGIGPDCVKTCYSL